MSVCGWLGSPGASAQGPLDAGAAYGGSEGNPQSDAAGDEPPDAAEADAAQLDAAPGADAGSSGELDAAAAVPVPPLEPLPALQEAPSPAPPRAQPPPLEVMVRARPSQAKSLQQSADAVTVLDTQQARKRSADLGEVLARVQGVSLRRAGGLGSDVRFSLNGLYDDQIRFFLDGVPLEAAGYPFGIANVPVNLTERIEIYRGVVPVRLGADALGGAVNLISDQRRGNGGSASLQYGSFGTLRATAAARAEHAPSGFVVRAAGFLDDADNDYPIEVNVPDLSGALRRVRVPRFHDAYRGWGGSLELGVVERPWAQKLLLRAFTAGYTRSSRAISR